MTKQNKAIIEEGYNLLLDFQKLKRALAKEAQDVVPVVLQEHDSKDVLMVGFMNQEAFELTLQTKKIVLWSTSRHTLWKKGSTSGNTLSLVDTYVNCEQNSLLILVKKDKGVVCHTKNAKGEHRETCYYRRLENDTSLDFTN